MAMLELLELAGGRLTAAGLERLLANPALQQQQQFGAEEAAAIAALQRIGSDGPPQRAWARRPTACWCLDRWLLTGAPQSDGHPVVWLHSFRSWTRNGWCVGGSCWIIWCVDGAASAPSMQCWVELLQDLLHDLFGDAATGAGAAVLVEALEDWRFERRFP